MVLRLKKTSTRVKHWTNSIVLKCKNSTAVSKHAIFYAAASCFAKQNRTHALTQRKREGVAGVGGWGVGGGKARTETDISGFYEVSLKVYS